MKTLLIILITILCISCNDNNKVFLYAIDIDTGKKVWKERSYGSITSPAIDENYLFYADYGLYTMDINGKDIYSLKTIYSKISGTPELNYYYVFVSAENGILYCYPKYDNDLKWNKQLKGESLCIKATDDLLFVGDIDGSFYCIDVETGNVIWTQHANKDYISKPLLIDSIVVVSNDDGNLYCWSQKDGKLIWKADIGEPASSSPILYDSIIYIGTKNGEILGFNKKQGNVIWSFKINGLMTSTPLIEKDRLYIGCNKSFYCIDLKSKKVIWKFDTDYWIISSPVLNENQIIFGGTDGYLYALNKSTGTMNWNFFTGGPIENNSPTIKDNLVFIGSNSGWIIESEGKEYDLREIYSK